MIKCDIIKTKVGECMKELFNTTIASLCTTFVFLLGGIDVALVSLIIVMILDYITGVLSAYYNKELSSKIGFKGVLKKIFYLIIIALSVRIDILMGESDLIRTFVIYYFVANDGLSILENASELGIKLPKKLFDALAQLKEKGDSE